MLTDHFQRLWKNYLIFFGLLLLIVATNWSSISSPFIGDDEYFINASLVPGFVSYPHFFLFANAPFYFRPLVFMVWSLEFALFGYSAVASHLINIVFQAGIAFLLFRLMTRLWISWPTALLVSVLFAVTPMSVEVISWSAGRGDCMSVFFILLAMNLFLTYLRGKNRYFLGGFLLSAAAGLLSKEIAYILLILIPAMVILFGGPERQHTAAGADLEAVPRATTGGRGNFRYAVWMNRGPWMAVSAFTVVFAGLTALRFLLLGGMGGAYRLYDVPSLDALSSTMKTMLAPFSYIEVAHSKLSELLDYTSLLVVASLAMVVVRWRKTPAPVRRAWIFFTIFFAVSFVPIFGRALTIGIGSNLEDSRFLYTPTLAFLAMLALGLLEFGWRDKRWKALAMTALVLLVPAYIFGTVENSRLWNREAVAINALANETRDSMPDPEPNAKLLLRGAPANIWKYYYGSGLDEAVRIAYGRDDIDVEIVESFPKAEDLRDEYLFNYDPATGRISFVSGPEEPDPLAIRSPISC
ncbi:MAG: hypothetical protein ACYCXF_08420 [Thermoleophilia bacterium]